MYGPGRVIDLSDDIQSQPGPYIFLLHIVWITFLHLGYFL